MSPAEQAAAGAAPAATTAAPAITLEDVDRAVEFDQSNIYKKLYEDEFGMPGGSPYGALIGDYEFTNHPEDVELLSKMSNVAAAAFCPFVSAAAPELFGFKGWRELAQP